MVVVDRAGPRVQAARAGVVDAVVVLDTVVVTHARAPAARVVRVLGLVTGAADVLPGLAHATVVAGLGHASVVAGLAHAAVLATVLAALVGLAVLAPVRPPVLPTNGVIVRGLRRGGDWRGASRVRVHRRVHDRGEDPEHGEGQCCRDCLPHGPLLSFVRRTPRGCETAGKRRP